jgi:hypothetical protein
MKRLRKSSHPRVVRGHCNRDYELRELYTYRSCRRRHYVACVMQVTMRIGGLDEGDKCLHNDTGENCWKAETSTIGTESEDKHQDKYLGWVVDGSDSGPCPMMGFGIRVLSIPILLHKIGLRLKLSPMVGQQSDGLYTEWRTFSYRQACGIF